MSSFLLTAVEQEEEKKNLTCKGENSFRNYLQVRKVKKKKKSDKWNKCKYSPSSLHIVLYSILFPLTSYTHKKMYVYP